MADTDVKQLLLQVDASVELLRRELDKGERKISDFDRFVAQKMRSVDQSFVGMGRGLTGVRGRVNEVQTSIIAMGASLASYFGGRELIQFVDNFTRLQNALRVAGLEGTDLKTVQDALFVSAQNNGVAINTLADLYGKAASAERELGATQSQLLKLTDLTAKSLLITGTSTEQASGAILGLGQALGNTKLQAEEFNQINEGGLRPLLQAAAANDRFGGSVSKLRQAVVDGKVTNKEFFDLILQGAQDIETKASKATLTLSAGYNALTNALTIYFGEADKSNGVSAALGETMQALAENLDTIVPAVALLVTALGVRYVVAATSAAASTLLTSNAMIALQARMAGAATSAEALSFAMQGMKGGAITAVILALGGALYFAKTRWDSAGEATERYAKNAAEAGEISKRVTELTDKLAAAKGRERAAALANAAALREETRQKLQNALASLKEATAAIAVAQAKSRDLSQGGLNAAALNPEAGAAAMVGGNFEGARGEKQAVTNLKAQTQVVRDLTAEYERLGKLITAPASISVPGRDGGKGKGKGGGSGRSPEDIRQQFNQELLSYWTRIASADADTARNAEEAADFEKKQIEFARRATLNDLNNNKDYSAAQRARLRGALDEASNAELERVEREKTRRIEQEVQQLADARHQSQIDDLQVQYDIADSNAERRRLALAMVDLEIRHQRAVLDATIASNVAADADKERARILLAGLDKVGQGRRAQASQDHETPGERYIHDLEREAVNLGDAYEDAAVNGLQRLNDSIADTAKSALGLHGVLGDIVGDLIEIAIRQAVIGPLASAIFGGGGGGFLGGLFGRANGGPVQAGRPYRVGEHGRPEIFVPRVPGKIVPQGSGGGGTAQPAVTVSLVLNAPGATAETEAMIRRTLASFGPSLVEAAKASMARDMNRRRIG